MRHSTRAGRLYSILILTMLITASFTTLFPGVNQGSEPPAPIPQVDEALIIQQIIDSINESVVEYYIRHLSEDFIGYFGGPTRYWDTSGNRDAAEYIYDVFERNGLQTEYEHYTYLGIPKRNVMGVLPGVDPSTNEEFVIGAHFDSTSGDPYYNAPGADDDATGVAVVLAAAEILSDYRFNKTIRFCAFNNEEQGLLGSGHLAWNISNSGVNVRAMMQYDMMAYNDNYPEMDVVCTEVGDASGTVSEWVADKYIEVNQQYGLGVMVCKVVRQSASEHKNSDHARFWDYGYNATCAIEHAPPTTSNATYSANPYFHKPTDTIDKLNLTLQKIVTQLGLAVLADLAEVQTDDTEPPVHYDEYPAPGSKTNNSNTVIYVNISDPSGIDESSIRLWVNGFEVLHDKSYINMGWNVSYQHPTFYSDGTIPVRIVAQDVHGNLLDYSWSFTVDTTEPEAPIDLTIQLIGDDIKLTWTNSTSPDTDYYQVFRNTTPSFDLDNPYNATVRADNFTDEDAAGDWSRWYYAVRGVDDVGNKGPLSQVVWNGDWVVETVQDRSGMDVVLNGNLTVLSGGVLNLSDFRLEMNSTYDGQYHIEVQSGGTMNITDTDSDPQTAGDASVITNSSGGFNYTFWVRGGSEFNMKNSELHGCGYGSGLQNSGLYIKTPFGSVENSLLSNNKCGLIVDSTTFSLSRITLKDNEIALYINSSSNALVNSSIADCGIDAKVAEGSFLTLLNVSFGTDRINVLDSSNLTVKWFMHVNVTDIDGDPVPYATVRVNDSAGSLVGEYTTDMSGRVRWVVVTERVQETAGVNTTFTPHNVTVEKYGFLGYAEPEPVMDATKYVEITMSDNVATPAPPLNIRCDLVGSQASATDIRVSWDASISPGVTDYFVYRGTSPTTVDFENPLNAGGLQLYYDDAGAIAGAPEYYYSVRAFDGTDYSDALFTAGKYTVQIPSDYNTLSIPLRPFEPLTDKDLVSSLSSNQIPGIQQIFTFQESLSTPKWIARLPSTPDFVSPYPIYVEDGFWLETNAATQYTFTGHPARQVRMSDNSDLDAPANFDITWDGNDLRLDWDILPGAAKYNIYKSSSITGFDFGTPVHVTADGNENYYVDIGANITDGEMYYMVAPVDSLDREGNSTYSHGKFTRTFGVGYWDWSEPFKTESSFTDRDYVYLDSFYQITNIAQVFSYDTASPPGKWVARLPSTPDFITPWYPINEATGCWLEIGSGGGRYTWLTAL